MSAKELCSMLITRSLKDLNEDEEEIVVDYLEKIGIETDIDTKPRELCLLLLEKTMEKELKKRVPITAYANQILGKEKEIVKEKETRFLEQKIETERKEKETLLRSRHKNLPGCIPSLDDPTSKKFYNFIVDPELGIEKVSDGTSHYKAVVSINLNLYSQIFSTTDNPVLELTSSQDKKAYARIADVHDQDLNTVFVSPLIAYILNLNNKDGGFIKVCSSLPEIKKVKFTYYGGKNELEEILPNLIEKLPIMVNAFSYLSLGMILLVKINGRDIKVRVDRLLDSDDRPLFAGLIPFGEGDLPFEIEPDF